MKKIQLLIYGLLLSLLTVHAADKNTRWHTYLAMYNTVAVAEAESNVYAVADGTLYSYGKSDDNIRVYSRQTHARHRLCQRKHRPDDLRRYLQPPLPQKHHEHPG